MKLKNGYSHKSRRFKIIFPWLSRRWQQTFIRNFLSYLLSKDLDLSPLISKYPEALVLFRGSFPPFCLGFLGDDLRENCKLSTQAGRAFVVAVASGQLAARSWLRRDPGGKGGDSPQSLHLWKNSSCNQVGHLWKYRCCSCGPRSATIGWREGGLLWQLQATDRYSTPGA